MHFPNKQVPPKAFFLLILAFLIAGGFVATIAQTSAGALPIPPLLTPDVQYGVKVFTLNAALSQKQIAPSLPVSQSMSYNGLWPGPTIKVSEGDTVRMVVNNNLGESTTIHWHGLHIPAADDGGIEEVIPAGQTWTPQFMIRQPASTNWYHPHLMGATGKQVAMGLTGMFIIDDGSATEAALPHQYGVDDIPVVLQSLAASSSGKVLYDEGDLQTSGNSFPLLINGVNTATSVPTFSAPGSRVRLRVLNASIGDILTLSFADGQNFSEIATDGGFLAAPLSVSSVRVGPAERVELIVDMNQSRTLQATVEPALITGGNGTHPVLQLIPSDTAPEAPLPTSLNTIAPLNTSGAVTRQFQFTYDPPTGNIFAGFGINGVVGTSMTAMMDNAVHVSVGTTEIWNVINNTIQTHFFHMHDGSFQILSINGALPAGDKQGWKDTVEVPSGTSLQLAFHFTDYTDAAKAYMLHCHLEPHEDQGMMALFYVDPVFKNNQGRQTGDFDGDGKSDYTVQRPGGHNWFVTPSGNASAAFVRQWGLPGDIPVTGDFDGDGKADLAVWRPSTGEWYITPSSNPSAPYFIQWGLAGDVPIPGDFDGDGKSDLVVWRPSNGSWFILPSSNQAAPYTQQWGLSGDIPLISDFDNDGKLDFVVWRPSTGIWYILPSSNPTIPIAQQWGLPGDIPLIGDYDGDGKNDFTVWRPSDGTWYIMPTSNPGAPIIQQWGLAGDSPIARDFDGDKKTDLAVWRPANGTWYVIPSSNPGAPIVRQWGLSGDIPL